MPTFAISGLGPGGAPDTTIASLVVVAPASATVRVRCAAGCSLSGAVAGTCGPAAVPNVANRAVPRGALIDVVVTQPGRLGVLLRHRVTATAPLRRLDVRVADAGAAPICP